VDSLAVAFPRVNSADKATVVTRATLVAMVATVVLLATVASTASIRTLLPWAQLASPELLLSWLSRKLTSRSDPTVVLTRSQRLSLNPSRRSSRSRLRMILRTTKSSALTSTRLRADLSTSPRRRTSTRFNLRLRPSARLRPRSRKRSISRTRWSVNRKRNLKLN